jgi:voltage-gated potassium channel
MDNRDEYEQKVLKRVAISLWLIIMLIFVVTYLVKDGLSNLREAIFAATSIITQIYVTNPEYGSIIFLLAFLGKILIIYIIYILIVLFNEGMFKESLVEGKIMKNIKQMKDHYIICGGGRVGGRVAEDLKAHKKKFVIIDKDLEIVKSYRNSKITALDGDSLDDEVLKKAGIAKAKVLISCLDGDGNNILQIITAKKANKKIKIVSRASFEKFIPNLKSVGADEIIIPEIIGSQKIAETARKFK